MPRPAASTRRRRREGRPAAHHGVGLRHPKVKKAYPFADLLRESIEAAAPRPVTPAYSDISLAIQKTFHPPDGVDPNGIEDKLEDRMEKAAEGKIF